MPPVDQIIAYEAGDLSDEDTIALFQQGIDEGWIWTLQGSYGRQAERLINYGLCTPAKGHA